MRSPKSGVTAAAVSPIVTDHAATSSLSTKVPQHHPSAVDYINPSAPSHRKMSDQPPPAVVPASTRSPTRKSFSLNPFKSNQQQGSDTKSTTSSSGNTTAKQTSMFTAAHLMLSRRGNKSKEYTPADSDRTLISSTSLQSAVASRVELPPPSNVPSVDSLPRQSKNTSATLELDIKVQDYFSSNSSSASNSTTSSTTQIYPTPQQHDTPPRPANTNKHAPFSSDPRSSHSNFAIAVQRKYVKPSHMVSSSGLIKPQQNQSLQTPTQPLKQSSPLATPSSTLSQPNDTLSTSSITTSVSPTSTGFSATTSSVSIQINNTPVSNNSLDLLASSQDSSTSSTPQRRNTAPTRKDTSETSQDGLVEEDYTAPPPGKVSRSRRGSACIERTQSMSVVETVGVAAALQEVTETANAIAPKEVQAVESPPVEGGGQQQQVLKPGVVASSARLISTAAIKSGLLKEDRKCKSVHVSFLDTTSDVPGSEERLVTSSLQKVWAKWEECEESDLGAQRMKVVSRRRRGSL